VDQFGLPTGGLWDVVHAVILILSLVAAILSGYARVEAAKARQAAQQASLRADGTAARLDEHLVEGG